MFASGHSPSNPKLLYDGHVRFGSKADICSAKRDVRFTKLCAAVFSTRSLPSKKSVFSKSRLRARSATFKLKNKTHSPPRVFTDWVSAQRQCHADGWGVQRIQILGGVVGDFIGTQIGASQLASGANNTGWQTAFPPN